MLVIDRVDSCRQQLSELILKIHSNPELAFEEVKAATWLTQYLNENEFSIEEGICGLPTAFRATYGKGKPVIAYIAQYDALPGLGHACGHNLIAGSAVGAGVASKLAVEQFGGTILVIGTPAEEKYGGKTIMISKGAFDNLDIAMMVHPDMRDASVTQTLTAQFLDVEFFSKGSISALDTMIQVFTDINSLRQHIKDSSGILGIITDGGQAANVPITHSAALFIVRAEDDAYLGDLRQKIINCITRVADVTDTRLEYKWGVPYVPLRSNSTLAQIFRQNMVSLGREVLPFDSVKPHFSSDLGNVSQLVPTIFTLFAIAPEGVPPHTSQFAVAAASETGICGSLDAAKALSMTAVDLLANPEIVIKVKDEFLRNE